MNPPALARVWCTNYPSLFIEKEVAGHVAGWSDADYQAAVSKGEVDVRANCPCGKNHDIDNELVLQ